MKTIRKLCLLSASAAAILPLGAAHAGGFYLQEQSVRAVGRAFSGEVADTGAASLWWNPAAIAGAPGEAYFGASAILPSAHVDDNGTTIKRLFGTTQPVGGDPTAKDPITKGVLPSGAISKPLNDKLAIGLAVTSPYSFTTNYDSDSWARYLADKTKLRTFDIQPTVAYQPTDWLRLGAGVNIEHADATLSSALPNLTDGTPDGFERLTGKGWDVGYSVGAQIVTDRVTVGVAYKSSVKHKLKGNILVSGLVGFAAGANTDEGATASFRTPWQLNAGARVRATDKLTLNVQGSRIGWNKFDEIDLSVAASPVIPENYRNTWSIAGGFDYDLTPTTTIRSGIQWDQTPTRNGQRDPRVPDSNRINFAAGASHKLNDRMTVDLAASYVKFDKAEIDRDEVTATRAVIDTNGTVRAHAIVLALGGRYSF